jgi:hypothetical protein
MIKDKLSASEVQDTLRLYQEALARVRGDVTKRQHFTDALLVERVPQFWKTYIWDASDPGKTPSWPCLFYWDSENKLSLIPGVPHERVEGLEPEVQAVYQRLKRIAEIKRNAEKEGRGLETKELEQPPRREELESLRKERARGTDPKKSNAGKKPSIYVAKRNEIMSEMQKKEAVAIAERLDEAKLQGEYIKDHDPWLRDRWKELQAAMSHDKSLQCTPSYTKAISFPWLMKRFKRVVRDARRSSISSHSK